MKSKRNGSIWYKVLFISMVGCSVALVIINVFTLVVLPLTGKVNLDYEQTAIQNIINIFGIAVSVWVGLSIAERMDRSEILILKKQANEIEEQLAENEKINLQLLLNDLRGNERYDIALFIIQKINRIDANAFSSGVWTAMREAEQLLNKLLNCKVGDDSNIVYMQYTSCVDNIRRLIEKNKNDAAVKSVNEILDFRMMRARFLIGYRTDKKIANQYFIECVEFFVKKSEQFGLDLSNVSDKYVLDAAEAETVLESCLVEREYDWDVYAYLFNVIGQSYSEIIHNNYRYCEKNDRTYPKKCNSEKCGILAVNYGLLTVTSAQRGKTQCEAYYRNYGCAIERINYGRLTEPVLWRAIEQYENAFRLDAGHRLVYYCLTSAYNKIFEVRTGLIHRDKDKKITEIELRGYDNRKMKEFFCDYERWISLYLKCFPQEESAHRMATLFYRNRYLWKGEELSVKCLREQLFVLERMPFDIRKKDEYKDGIEICKKSSGDMSNKIK